MESASKQRVCVAKQASPDSGRFTFNFAHAKLAADPPTFETTARGDRSAVTRPSVDHTYRGGHHPLASGDGHRL